MRGSAALRTGITPGGALAGPWVRNPLWTAARAVPSLDLRFAENKSLTDATTGQNLVTFTRASSGTYVDSQGVIKTATTNLCLRSAEFDTAANWIPGAGSVTANTQAAPDGSLTADTFTTGVGTNSLHQVISCAASTTYTWSFYVRLGTLPASDFRFAVRDDSNSAFIAQDIVPNVTPVTSEWRRVTYTFTTPAGCVLVRPYTYRFVPITGGTFHLWGAQLEASSVVGEYVPTTSTINSAPRFDHNPTTGESLGLLVEEQRTNSIRNNTMVGAVAGTPGTLPTNWGTLSSITGITAEIVGTGTSNGITYIDIKLAGTSSAASAYHLVFDANTAIAASTGQTWTSSSYVALVAGSFANIATAFLRCTERVSGGSFVGATEVTISGITSNLSNNRIVVSRTLGATAAFVQGGIIVNVASGVAIDITLRIGLPQLEQGAFATSVIPTTTAAATRSADVASISGSNFSSWFNGNNGTVLWDGRLGSTAGNTAIFSLYNSSGSSSNRHSIRQGNTIVTSGGNQVANFLQTAPAGARAKFGYGYAVDDYFQAYNSSTTASDTSGALPTGIDSLDIGKVESSGIYSNGAIARFTYWPQRLSNSALQSITQ